MVVDQRGVVVGAQQIAALLETRKQLAVVDVEAERARGRVEICAVDEEGNFFSRIEHVEISFMKRFTFINTVVVPAGLR